MYGPALLLSSSHMKRSGAGLQMIVTLRKPVNISDSNPTVLMGAIYNRLSRDLGVVKDSPYNACRNYETVD